MYFYVFSEAGAHIGAVPRTIMLYRLSWLEPIKEKKLCYAS